VLSVDLWYALIFSPYRLCLTRILLKCAIFILYYVFWTTTLVHFWNGQTKSCDAWWCWTSLVTWSFVFTPLSMKSDKLCQMRLWYFHQYFLILIFTIFQNEKKMILRTFYLRKNKNHYKKPRAYYSVPIPH
jgi:hypothetical protein